MARRCDVCGKGLQFGNTVSHAKNRSRTSWRPNLHEVKTEIEGTRLHVRVCSRCLKAGKVVKVV